ncbi:radical SAM protein [bacterium]|nr:radical SAM protein [bacterium]
MHRLPPFMPSKTEILKSRLPDAYRLLRACGVCPRACGVNRILNEKGFCGGGLLPRIASDNLHFGEEPPVSGFRGSGTIFLTGCTMHCAFCQNYPISQLGNGKTLTIRELANRMLRLQKSGAHNINFVTPTHFVPQIMAALYLACRAGFTLPVLYNSSGYESVEVLKLLDGIVDIYLPDMKYQDPVIAEKYSRIRNYPDINKAAVKEMLRQTGHLEIDEKGIAVRGLIIRHLILPNGSAGTREILKWIRDHLGSETHISLMRQYFPAHQAVNMPEMNTRISDDSYREAVRYMEELGLENGWIQE